MELSDPQTRKERILALAQQERQQREALLPSLAEDQLVRPGVVGAWSGKDVLPIWPDGNRT